MPKRSAIFADRSAVFARRVVKEALKRAREKTARRPAPLEALYRGPAPGLHQPQPAPVLALLHADAAIMLEARGAQAGHAMTVDRRPPAFELLQADTVALAGVLEA